jgi:hypothetical protein
MSGKATPESDNLPSLLPFFLTMRGPPVVAYRALQCLEEHGSAAVALLPRLGGWVDLLRATIARIEVTRTQ